MVSAFPQKSRVEATRYETNRQWALLLSTIPLNDITKEDEVKMLGALDFTKDDLPAIFGIGYLSNDVIRALSKILRGAPLSSREIGALHGIANVFLDAELGKGALDDFRWYRGSDTERIDTYIILIKLIYNGSQKPLENVIARIREIRLMIERLAKKPIGENEKQMDRNIEKIEMVKNFLSMLSGAYRKAFSSLKYNEM